jgi:2-keto-3-deoxy-galactonokinase
VITFVHENGRKNILYTTEGNSGECNKARVNASSALSTNATGQLKILWLQRSTTGVNSAQVAILEQADQIRLSGLLKSRNSRGLEAQIGFEILTDFSHKTLEGHAANEELSGLLVATDFAKGDGA